MEKLEDTVKRIRAAKYLIDIKEVCKRTTLSRCYIYKLMALGEFPRQVKLGPRCVAWVETEIEAYIQAAINNRG